MSGGPDVVAAGAVVWRAGSDGGVEIALVHRPRYDDWSLPKGKLDHGESAPVAAVREVAEETGVVVALGVRLGESHYRVPQGEKVVHYWAARAEGATPTGFAPDDEVDELRWVRPEAADGVLSYQRDQEILDRFRALSPDGRPPTPLLLVRHAKAGNRDGWEGDDDRRPLSGKGRRQADDLVDLLSLFRPARAHAAPPVRCLDTIRPLTERLGLAVTEEPLLGEHGYWADPDTGLNRLLALVTGTGPAVVCSQGGVIPDVVEQLLKVDDPPAAKASTWVLGFAADGRTSVTADYYPAPER